MEIGVDYTIRELHPDDRLNSFRTGDAAFAPLKSFLRNQALDFHIGNVAKTYVAIKLAPVEDAQVVEDGSAGVLRVFGSHLQRNRYSQWLRS